MADSSAAPRPSVLAAAFGGPEARPIEGFWHGALVRLRRNKLATIAGFYLIVLVLIAIVGPALLPYRYDEQQYEAVNAPPSWSHWMGTDELGRDVLARLVFGARISLTVGVVVQGVILLIGVPIGIFAGYTGGKIDTLLMRLVDVLYALPNLLFVIVIMTYLRGTMDSDPGGVWSAVTWLDAKTGGLIGVYIGLGMIGWLTVARIVRANAMSIKRKEFVEAARGMGARDRRVMGAHVLPNTVAPIVVAATLGIPSAILSEAGISFLGLGVIPPMPSWGLMIADAIPGMRSHPHLLIFPAVALSLTVLAFNFLGDGLRDALDPYMKR